jgi:hypothetical protein
MSFNLDRVYNLLPAVHRERDHAAGQPLKALLAIIADQMQVVEDDVDRLYQDLFIETCQPWVIPYVGDLIGHDAIYAIDADSPSSRAEVARTIAYRRRKGTLSVLEQMSHDVTGWAAHAVEYFQLLSTTQWLNHLRMARPVSPDLRQWELPVFIDSPFDQTLRTLDIRHIGSRRGRYNIPNIGVHFWRLRAFLVTRGSAARVSATRYTFDPLGLDIPLFNPGQPLANQQSLTQPINIPDRLNRRAVYEDLNRERLYFGAGPIWRVFVNNSEVSLENTRVAILTAWDEPPAPVSGFNIAIDPKLGRITFSTNLAATDKVEVLYSYGFPGPYGAGPYPRAYPRADVTIDVAPADSLVTKLGTVAPGTPTAVEIDHSLTIAGDLAITLQPGQRLTLRSNSGARPVIDGALNITAAADSALTLDGLLIAKGITVAGAGPFSLTVNHSTVRRPAAGQPSLVWTVTAAAAGAGQIRIDHSLMLGPIHSGAADHIAVADSLVESLAADNAGQSAGVLQLVRSTVFGSCAVREIDLIEDSIAAGNVISERTQTGCVRFSYVTPASQTPRHYRCQPETAVAIEVQRRQQLTQVPLTQIEIDAITARVRSRVQPAFTGIEYGDPAFAQLDATCPIEIRTGASDGSEMGIFHDLFQPRRETNAVIRMNEYLRLGLETGTFYRT